MELLVAQRCEAWRNCSHLNLALWVVRTNPPGCRIRFPLPQLPAAIQHKLAVAKADALVVLYEELQACWNNCTLARPRLTVDPGCFIQAFVEYGVALYEAQAAALLGVAPNALEYKRGSISH